MKGLSKYFEAARTNDGLAIIGMPPGFGPLIIALDELFRGRGYLLFIDGNKTGARQKIKTPLGYALRDRWLYKYAAKIVVDCLETKLMMENELVGLDVPVVLASCETTISRPLCLQCE